MTKAILSWHLFIDCPKCKETIDLADGEHDQDSIISIPIFNNRWNDLKGTEICCDCGHEFKLSGIEY